MAEVRLKARKSDFKLEAWQTVMDEYWQFVVLAAILSVFTQLWEALRPKNQFALLQDIRRMDWVDKGAFVCMIVGLTALHGVVNGAILWISYVVLFAPSL